MSRPHQLKQQGPAFNVPVLPHTAPEAEQPQGLKLPLMPHQLRALNRCLVIEQDGSLLNQDFGHRFDFKSRGGCLADSVGTGKTATSIGLVLSGKEEQDDVDDQQRGGGTLVVAPAHLIPQWKHEIQKFAGDSIQVLVGKEEYYRVGQQDLPSHCSRRIVLVAVDDVLNEPKLWYDWRRVFTKEPGKAGGGHLIKKVPADKMEVYRKAALFSVKSPKGPCTYTGWVYTGLLHLPHKPWRRVIYDEIQDLVSEGTESQKNLLQLSRTAQHVWLLSATPFPHGNSSVYANHELLGFCRLRLDIPSTEQLPADHVFERIKRQIYIRSPRHVADQAVTASQLVTRTTLYISQLDLEQCFYNLENDSIRENNASFDSRFDQVYYPLRQMTVHPEASEKLRRQMSQANSNNNNNNNNRVRPVSASGSVNQAAQRAILAAKARLRTIESQDLKRAAKQLRDATRSLELAEKILVHRARPVATSVFAVGNSGTDVTRASREEEKKIVHGHYCACTGGLGSADCYADRKIFFRIMRDENSNSEAEFIHGVNATDKVIQYLDGLRGDHTMRSKSLQQYITSSKRSVAMRKENLENQEKEKRELLLRTETLSQASKPGAVKDESDALAAMHGSKPAALVRFLQAVTAKGEQVIVFSYWHDTLKLIGQTLSRCGLRSVFCSGNGAAMALALQEFTTNISPILLLSAQSKASGANLQCAAHVILLDPAGSSAEHGSTLEEQAVGRAVRMGQLKPVTVTRFCVTGTIEEDLFSEIDSAAVSAKKGSCDKYVITDFNSKAAAVPKREEKASKNSQEEGEEDDDVNDVKVTGTVSPGEQLRRTFQKAQENGNVISLDDGNDNKATAMPSTSSEEEEKEEDVDDIKVTETVSPNERIRRKFQSAQENGNVICLDPDDDKEDCDPNVPITDGKRPNQDADRESKRMRSEQQEESQTSVQSDPETTTNANFTPAPPGSAVASVSSGSSVGGTPDSDHGNSDKSGFSAVRDLLRRLDLAEYAPNFLDCGLDNLEWLYQFSQDLAVMEKLSTTVGFKPGHAVRFQFGLSKEASTHTVAASTAADPDSSWI